MSKYNPVICLGFALFVFVTKATTLEFLSRTARDVEQLMDDKFLDANSILMSHLNADFKPYVGNDPPGVESITIPGVTCTKGEFRTYENSGMVQGAFLAALCEKIKATQKTQPRDALQARQKAARTYRAITQIYDLSKQGGEGFFCKPWGWRFQDETSSDQYIYTLAGLYAYDLFIPTGSRVQLRDMGVKMSTFWAKHHYDWKYYSLPLHWQKSRFISFSALAMYFSNDLEGSAELARLLADPMVTNDVPFRASLKYSPRKMADGGIVYTVNGENAMSGFLSVWAQLVRDPKCAYANSLLPHFYDLAVVSLAPDGSGYAKLVRQADGSFVEMDPKRTTIAKPGKDPPWNWLFFCVSGPYRHGGQASAMAVNALVQMAPYYKPAQAWVDNHAVDALAHIANGHFTWFEDPHGILPPSLKWMTDVRSADAVANWLWAYWTLSARMAEKGK